PQCRHLCPATGGAAEIDHAATWGQQVKTLIELEQLEGGARTKAHALGVGDKRIVELAVQPFGRGRLAPPRAPDPDSEGPRARAAIAAIACHQKNPHSRLPRDLCISWRL